MGLSGIPTTPARRRDGGYFLGVGAVMETRST